MAVAQTYGTHHKPGYDPTYQEGFSTNANANSNNLAPIGATAVPNMATTTYDEVITVSPTGPNRAFDLGAETGQSGEYPIGEPMVLLLFAAAFAGTIAYKKIRPAAK